MNRNLLIPLDVDMFIKKNDLLPNKTTVRKKSIYQTVRISEPPVVDGKQNDE